MSSPFSGCNIINFYATGIFFSINRPGVKAKVTITLLEALYQELIIAKSIWAINLVSLFISHSPIFNFGSVLNGNGHKIIKRTIKFPDEEFHAESFWQNIVKKDKIYSNYSRRLRIPINSNISRFKVEKLAPTGKNYHQLSLKEKVSDVKDKNSYIIIFNFPKLSCSTVL